MSKWSGRNLMMTILFFPIFYLLSNLVVMVTAALAGLGLLTRQLGKIVYPIVYGKDVEVIVEPYHNGFLVHSPPPNIILILKCEGEPNKDKFVQIFQTRVLDLTTTQGSDGSTLPKPLKPYNRLRCGVDSNFSKIFHLWRRHRQFDLNKHIHFHHLPSPDQSPFGENCPEFLKMLILPKNDPDKSDLDSAIELASQYYTVYDWPDPLTPMWALHVLVPPKKSKIGVATSTTTSEFAILFVIHHVYCDGISMGQIFANGLADESVTLRKDPLKSPPKLQDDWKNFKFGTILKTLISTALLPHRGTLLLWNLIGETHDHLGLNAGRILASNKRTCKFTQIPMATVKRARRQMAAEFEKKGIKTHISFSLYLLSGVMEAFKKVGEEWRPDHKGELFENIIIYTQFAQYPYPSMGLFNRFWFYFFPHPNPILSGYLGSAAAETSNQKMAETMRLKHRLSNLEDIHTFSTILSMSSNLPRPIVPSIILKQYSPLTFTNVPGHLVRASIFEGHTVTAMFGFPPLAFLGQQSICVTSTDNYLTVSIIINDTLREACPGMPHNFLKAFKQHIQHLAAQEIQ